MSLLFILSILSLHRIFDFLLQTDKAVKEFLYATYDKNHSESSARWIESRNIFLSNIAECMLTINWINKSSIENILLSYLYFGFKIVPMSISYYLKMISILINPSSLKTNLIAP